MTQERTLGHFEIWDEPRRFKPTWRRLHPNSGSWWFDLLALCVLSAVESFFIPHITSGRIAFDLMTPWLVVGFVTLPFHQIILHILVAGMLQETVSVAPFGLYICSYWVIGAMIYLVRSTLSWRLYVPWLVTFFFSLFWVVNFETFVVFVNRDPLQLDFFYFFNQLIRISVGCAVGMVLSLPWIQKFRGERVDL